MLNFNNFCKMFSAILFCSECSYTYAIKIATLWVALRNPQGSLRSRVRFATLFLVYIFYMRRRFSTANVFFFKRHSKLCCCGFVILFTRVEILNLSTVVLMSYWWAFMYQFFTFNFKKLNKKITTNIAEDYTFFRLLLNNHSTGWTLEPFVWQSFFAYHQWYETFRQPVITCRQSLFGWNFNFKFWWTYNFFLYIFCIHFRTLSDTIYFLSHLWGVDP